MSKSRSKKTQKKTSEKGSEKYQHDYMDEVYNYLDQLRQEQQIALAYARLNKEGKLTNKEEARYLAQKRDEGYNILFANTSKYFEL